MTDVEPRKDPQCVHSGQKYSSYEDWFMRGEVGISSKTILSAIRDIPFPGADIPYDHCDFRRCCLLLKAFPELREQLPKVAEKYPEWRALVEHWEEVEATVAREIGDIETKRGRARKTYALLQKLIAEGKRQGGAKSE